MCTRPSRKVIWDMIITLYLTTVAVEPTFFCFPLVLANVSPWPPVPFFQISLQKSELKTTHNTSRDCRVHFFLQAFSKQLYIIIMTRRAAPLYKRSEIGVADCYSTICLVLLCWKHEQKYNNQYIRQKVTIYFKNYWRINVTLIMYQG